MPTFSFRTTLREAEEGFVLLMVARHRLRLGTSDKPVKISGRLPEFDILPHSDLVLSVSGVHQKHTVSGSKMLAAYPTRHLTDFLRNVVLCPAYRGYMLTCILRIVLSLA